MKNDVPFRFKQFTVAHRHAMKVGTDAVLLGAWVSVHGAARILDIGSGCGVIALMLAQRTEPGVLIDGVEVDASSALEARANFAASKWSGRMGMHAMDVADYRPSQRYDLVVSNPPYFRQSLQSPSPKRNLARHDQRLSSEALVAAAVRLLSGNGRLAVILPSTEAPRFVTQAEKAGLHRSRTLTVRTRADRPVERILMELRFEPGAAAMDQLTLYASRTDYSPAYRQLVSDFLLAF